jgi:excinuclease ABC subunit B
MNKYQTLLGVTGSGKTFTIANVIEQSAKTNAYSYHTTKHWWLSLYTEFKEFFPDNKVEFFTSYYDYYQPEAYVAVTDTYIEKDLSINAEIEKLRLSTTTSLMSGRRDVIVVASVSCIYGLGNPAEYKNQIIRITKGQTLSRNTFLFDLVGILYARTTADFQRGNFRVKGDSVEVFFSLCRLCVSNYILGRRSRRARIFRSCFWKTNRKNGRHCYFSSQHLHCAARPIANYH